MIHCHSGRGICWGRIVIPGSKVHMLCPFFIIQGLIKAHQVGSDWNLRRFLPNGIILQLIALQNTLGIKPSVINGNGLELGSVLTKQFKMLAQCIGKYNLLPIIEGVTPECCIPGPVQLLHGLITLLQPYTKRLLTVLAVTLTAILIGNMPANDILLILIVLRQLSRQPCRIFPVNQAVWTGIVSAPELMLSALEIGTENLRIPGCHPGRMRAGGGSQTDFHIIVCYKLNDFIQPFKIIFILAWLNRGPGKYVQRNRINARLLK